MRGLLHCKVSCSSLFKASLPAGSASRHRDQFVHGGKTINVSFEETSVVNIIGLGVLHTL